MRRGSLAEERPDLITQWSSKNELSPSDVSCGSHKKVWWVCDKNHTWEATVKNRALIDSGCPYCEHRAVLKGYNDLRTLFPDVAKTWSPSNSLKPTEVSPASNREALWRCKHGHEWKARIADRTGGHGCPYCAGHKVWKGFNDLATTHPNLIPEWSEKNKGLSPDTITYKNRSNVWWHCSRCGNDYQAVVYAKANGRICPFCIAKEIQRLREIRHKNRRISQDFKYLLPQLAVIYYAGKQGFHVETDTETFIGMPVTAYIPDIRLVIDVCTSDKEISLKEYICSTHDCRYSHLAKDISATDLLIQICRVFAESHVYIESDPERDLEIIRDSYSHYRRKQGLGD